MYVSCVNLIRIVTENTTEIICSFSLWWICVFLHFVFLWVSLFLYVKSNNLIVGFLGTFFSVKKYAQYNGTFRMFLIIRKEFLNEPITEICLSNFLFHPWSDICWITRETNIFFVDEFRETWYNTVTVHADEQQLTAEHTCCNSAFIDFHIHPTDSNAVYFDIEVMRTEQIWICMDFAVQHTVFVDPSIRIDLKILFAWTEFYDGDYSLLTSDRDFEWHTRIILKQQAAIA